MKTYQIWAEGYLATGMEGKPQRAYMMGTAKGATFEEACVNFMKSNPEYEGGKYYVASSNRYWGCKLFDNEADARKLFG